MLFYLQIWTKSNFNISILLYYTWCCLVKLQIMYKWCALNIQTCTSHFIELSEIPLFLWKTVMETQLPLTLCGDTDQAPKLPETLWASNISRVSEQYVKATLLRRFSAFAGARTGYFHQFSLPRMLFVLKEHVCTCTCRMSHLSAGIWRSVFLGLWQ